MDASHCIRTLKKYLSITTVFPCVGKHCNRDSMNGGTELDDQRLTTIEPSTVLRAIDKSAMTSNITSKRTLVKDVLKNCGENIL